MKKSSLQGFLDKKVEEYNHPSFIKSDPISIPRSFSKQQDIEISGLFAAIFSWGNRTTIINKSKELMQLMDNAPHDFILGNSDKDLKKLTGFKHRTFNTTDLLIFIEFLRFHYLQHHTLETAFAQWIDPSDETIEHGLTGFNNYFFSLHDSPGRTRKHIASPLKNSSCKRLNMYLRWMVRKDDKGVDFGIWKTISPAQLICPIDLHVARVAKRFGLLLQTQINWKSALELTSELCKMDREDPVKYDFALFNLGIMENY